MSGDQKAAPESAPRYLGAPVGGQAPARAISGAYSRILARIADADVRERLLGQGGEMLRAIAAELDDLRVLMNSTGAAPKMSDIEADALNRFLDEHFTLAGHTPAPGERLVMRTMMTLRGLVQELQSAQRALSEARTSGTPIG